MRRPPQPSVALDAAGMSDGPPLSEDIIDEAIVWVIRLEYNTPTPAVRHAFEQWRDADPLHALAWQCVGSLRQAFDKVPAHLAHPALAAADAYRRQARPGRRRALKLLGLGALALGAGWMVEAYAPWPRLLADASTVTGQRQTLTLADGTVIALNTDTAVSFDLTGDTRIVTLRRGEILVTTGADADAAARRPFWVHTPYGRMEALGTRFAVRLDAGRSRVSVQEGAVALHPVSGGAAYVVRPGESRWLGSDGTTAADLAGFDADSWADGVIAGKNMRLGDLLNELARYRHGTIHCDARVAELRVSGLYHTRDTDQTLQFLVQTQPISVRYHTRLWVSVGPAS
ncbi:MAG: FecR domain-containing protein [Rhodocyclaceae bacterium]